MTQLHPLRTLQLRRQQGDPTFKRYATLTKKQRADRDRKAAQAVKQETTA